jgi:DNA invertase Pin-like site-specific DNA recombinase
MGAKLTQDTIKQIIELYLQGSSSEVIGKQIGSKAQTITKYLRDAGIEIRGPAKKLTPEDI